MPTTMAGPVMTGVPVPEEVKSMVRDLAEDALPSAMAAAAGMERVMVAGSEVGVSLKP